MDRARAARRWTSEPAASASAWSCFSSACFLRDQVGDLRLPLSHAAFRLEQGSALGVRLPTDALQRFGLAGESLGASFQVRRDGLDQDGRAHGVAGGVRVDEQRRRRVAGVHLQGAEQLSQALLVVAHPVLELGLLKIEPRQRGARATCIVLTCGFPGRRAR